MLWIQLLFCLSSYFAMSPATGFDNKLDDVGTLQKPPFEIDSCTYWRNFGVAALENSHTQTGYDTLKKFIERCAWYPESWRTFSDLSGAAIHGASDGSLGYRDWLKTVLYLNTSDPEYFCACADAFSYSYDRINEQLAVIRYLLLNTSCDHDYLAASYTAERRTQYESWLSGDTTVPLDTTLPSIHDLGLDILLLKGVPAQSGGEGLIASVAVAPNPFNRGTMLRLHLSSPSYVTIELFDELGNSVRTVMRAQAMNAGEDAIPLDLAALAAGTYYVRVVCGPSTVRTLKVVKD